MARTWVEVDSTALVDGGGFGVELNTDGILAFNADHTVVYFATEDGQGFRIYSWNDTTFSDITGTTFNGVNDGIDGLVYFGGTLYALVRTNAAKDLTVYKWNGSQSWSSVTALEDENTDPVHAPAVAPYRQFVSDNDRIVAIGATPAPDNFGRVLASTDGSSYSLQTLDGGYDFAVGNLIGKEQYFGYSEIVIDTTEDETSRVHSSGVAWGTVGTTHSVNSTLIGYADSLSFWQNSGATHKSSNWGSNITQVVGVLLANVWDIDDTAIMANVDGAGSQTAYTWDGSDFITDGDVGSGELIRAFFKLDGVLYAMVDDTSNNCKMYSGGELPENFARFYHGFGTLEEKFDLPWTATNPGGMTLDKSLGTVVIGSAGGGSNAVVYSANPYPTGTGMTPIIPTGTAVTSLKWL